MQMPHHKVAEGSGRFWEVLVHMPHQGSRGFQKVPRSFGADATSRCRRVPQGSGIFKALGYSTVMMLLSRILTQHAVGDPTQAYLEERFNNRGKELK